MTQEASEVAAKVGRQLRDMRKKRFPKDTQADAAVRVGVARSTYQRMERGDPSVSFQHYLEAAWMLGCLGSFEDLFSTSDQPTGLLASMIAKAEKGHPDREF